MPPIDKNSQSPKRFAGYKNVLTLLKNLLYQNHICENRNMRKWAFMMELFLLVGTCES